MCVCVCVCVCVWYVTGGIYLKWQCIMFGRDKIPLLPSNPVVAVVKRYFSSYSICKHDFNGDIFVMFQLMFRFNEMIISFSDTEL